MELGAFDYQTKEQGELLTRLLCELDDILSFGDAEVKRARKALVVAIQSDALPLADALREQSARLKAFGEALLATLMQCDAVAPAVTATGETLSAAGGSNSSNDVASDVEMRPVDDDSGEAAELDGDDNDGDAESDSDDSEDEDMAAADDSDAESQDGENNDRDDDGSDDDDDDCEDDCEEQDDVVDDAMREQMAARRAQTTQTTPTHSPRSCDVQRHANTIDVQTLPVWRPYYQLQKRRDGLYLVANLRDVDPANVHVQWLESAGVLRISGHKLPTQKDLAVTRFSGVPTFGRFEIAERLPADVLAMDSATQALRADGTLEIRMPYYVMRPRPQLQFHPSLFSRGSLFDAPRCMVW